MLKLRRDGAILLDGHVVKGDAAKWLSTLIRVIREGDPMRATAAAVAHACNAFRASSSVDASGAWRRNDCYIASGVPVLLDS